METATKKFPKWINAFESDRYTNEQKEKGWTDLETANARVYGAANWLGESARDFYRSVAKLRMVEIMGQCKTPKQSRDMDRRIEEAQAAACARPYQIWDDCVFITIERRDPNDERQRRAIFGDEEK